MGSYSITYDATSVHATISGAAAGDVITIWLRTDADPTTWITPSSGYSHTSSGMAYIWSYQGLTPSTDYVINVRISHNGVPETLGAQYFTTPSQPTPRPSYWTWNTTESTALNNQGAFSAVTYSRWNAMVDKVAEVQDAAGVSWDSRYATKAATKCSASDRVLTAARYNSLRYNVGRYYATGISEVSPGDTVRGWHFLQLMKKVNDWIDSL